MAAQPDDNFMPASDDTAFQLKNRVILVRHGLAESNVKKVLVSDPKDGVPSFGLVEKGKHQAKEACMKLESILSNPGDVDLSEKLFIISSDFKRTRETAEIIHDHFTVKAPIRAESALRERGFGEFHFTESKNVRTIFEQDYMDPTHKLSGCESVTEMVLRVSRLISDLDREFTSKILILVSHGDPLQTLWAIFKGVPPNERWHSLPEFTNGEVRELPCV